MRFGRMLYAESGGMPLRFRRVPGFSNNFALMRSATKGRHKVR
jgi:hypothetical protein